MKTKGIKKVYVTENGIIDKIGRFTSLGVIGVDKEAREAISYIADQKALAIDRKLESFMKEVTYKVEGTTRGYRISIHTL